MMFKLRFQGTLARQYCAALSHAISNAEQAVAMPQRVG